jgi:sterol desaturase/sphingolipid hydroxylase (fatty acid hydroxylase superfamily)
MNFRLAFFLFGLIFFGLLGLLFPFVKIKNNFFRALTNLLMGTSGAIFTIVLFPGGLYLLALKLEGTTWGLLNRLSLPYFIEFLFTIIFFDLVIYAQHVLSHRLPFLWRFHKVHHGDPIFDTTTALRFHPGEIIISFLFKAALVFLFSFDKFAIVAFEILLNFSAMFNHSNFTLPKGVESLLRKFIVTPDFHRVHHSPDTALTNTNYGFFFSFWDYLFQTYNKRFLNNSTFGLKNEEMSASNNFFKVLAAPFIQK